MPYDTPAPGMAAALYGARPKKATSRFQILVSSLQADGKPIFTASASGKHQQLIFDPAQKDKVIKAYVELASAKPAVRQRFRPPVAADKKANEAVVPPKP